MKKGFWLVLLIVLLSGVVAGCSGNAPSLNHEESTVDDHQHVFEVEIKRATCLEEGLRTVLCKECGYVKDETVMPMVSHEYEVAVKEATCTEEGLRTKKCKVCGYVQEESVIPKVQHQYISTIIKPATCTEEGEQTLTCSACGYSTNEVVPKNSHDYIETASTATCTQDGQTIYTCSMCGDTKIENVKALGHSGKVGEKCARCGGLLSDYGTFFLNEKDILKIYRGKYVNSAIEIVSIEKIELLNGNIDLTLTVIDKRISGDDSLSATVKIKDSNGLVISDRNCLLGVGTKIGESKIDKCRVWITNCEPGKDYYITIEQ